jgi:hypothetical protein
LVCKYHLEDDSEVELDMNQHLLLAQKILLLLVAQAAQKNSGGTIPGNGRSADGVAGGGVASEGDLVPP